jgi:hypothetical protein
VAVGASGRASGRGAVPTAAAMASATGRGRHRRVGSGTRAWARCIACWCCPTGDTARSARGVLDAVESPWCACGWRVPRSAWAAASWSECPGRAHCRARP